MLKKELRKILLSLSFVFVVAVSYAQYVVTGGSGSPMKATQSSGDSAERLEVYLVYGMDKDYNCCNNIKDNIKKNIIGGLIK